MYLHAEWLLIGCKEAATWDFGRLRMYTALFYPCRQRVFHVVPAGWLDGKDTTGPRQLRPAYFFFFLQRQWISTLSGKEARSSRNRAQEQYGLLSSFEPLLPPQTRPQPTYELQTLAESFPFVSHHSRAPTRLCMYDGDDAIAG